MKYLIIILLLSSCKPTTYKHTYTYSVAVTYNSADKDTLSGEIVQSKSDSEKCCLYLELGKSGCMTVKNCFFNYDRLACNVRSFNIIEENTVTIKN